MLPRIALLSVPLLLAAAPLSAQSYSSAPASCASACDRVPRPVGLYVRTVDLGGRYLTLEDGSVWEVEYSDRATAAAWTADDFVRLSWIAAPRGDFEYLLTRAGAVDEKAAARLSGRVRG
jgi:hypothetical protein